MSHAQAIQKIPHEIVFTSGDLKHHNIMVDNGHVKRFPNRDSAGWYPEYWAFTTTRRYLPEDFWWYTFVTRLGGDKYAEEKGEKFLTNLTSPFYYW